MLNITTTGLYRSALPIFTCLSFLSVLIVPIATAAEQSEPTALVGGRLIDGFGNQPLANSVILVKNGLIEKVGTVDTLPVPTEYKIVSTEGMDVLPGLWEKHAHLMLNGHANYKHWHKEYTPKLTNEIMPASAEQLLLAGITSARDLGAPLKDSITIKNKIDNGEIPGPRLFVSGPFLQHEAYPGTEL